MVKTIIIIPTYNEIENIEKLIRDIKSINPEVHILIVDDKSPDGTAQCVQKLRQEINDLYLISREGKRGLGTAYVAGFKFALQNSYEYIFEMDADYSHDPREIPNFLPIWHCVFSISPSKPYLQIITFCSFSSKK